ncbi:hypothetical protein L249_2150 [Ophiocordyceps polyrhachis-furcata BCC 54312]|uniref:Uncharacterized protein n=1 Tax=Ophiocordyceps polyrhachis-furcata BCC 54312 TaxID=1330021 RepID=A0A367LPI5_9HYPO|nr:hypothetical protein L249_2150 [Ophiocordyceps polyrhachis-furcata BCC 54312]
MLDGAPGFTSRPEANAKDDLQGIIPMSSIQSQVIQVGHPGHISCLVLQGQDREAGRRCGEEEGEGGGDEGLMLMMIMTTMAMKERICLGATITFTHRVSVGDKLLEVADPDPLFHRSGTARRTVPR